MVLDNSKFEAMRQKFPTQLKFKLNPVYYAARWGIQGVVGGLTAAALGIYLFTYNNQAFPYEVQKTRREYYAIPDLYSGNVLLYDRTTQNAAGNL